jgi:acyl-CoA synthetase (AMP-forming)/AMP-acid ligase II
MNQLLLHEAFLASAARHPRRVAVTRGGESVTYAELADATRRCARALAAAGVRRSDRVAVRAETHLDLVPLFFATAALGAVFAPLSPKLTGDEARAVLDLADPRLVVAGEGLDGDLRPADLARSTATSGIDRAGPRETDGHVMYFTSGTTGRPKAIVLSHRTTMVRALPALSPFPAGPLVSMFPLFHMAGWSSAINPWLCGDEVVLADGGDAEDLVRAIERRRAHSFYAIPAVWRRILDLDLAAFDLRSLRHADTGTSATTPDLLDGIHEALPRTTTTVTYGSTEAAGVCRLPFEDVRRKPGSVGPPVPGVFVRVEDGELRVRSPYLFDGYYRDAEATDAALVDGWYRTGELAEIDDEGYISIVGRVSDMIRSGGETIAPAEVDGVLLTHPAVLDAAVAGVPHDDWGEIVTAFVVVRPGASLGLPELQRHCAGRLARYKVPRRLVTVEAIPRTGATRQVQRRRLAATA